MGIVELCHGRENSIDFLAGALYTGILIPMTSLLASEPCLSNLQNSATLSRASERACFSLISHRREGTPGRQDEPEPEVGDLELEAVGQGTDPDL